MTLRYVFTIVEEVVDTSRDYHDRIDPPIVEQEVEQEYTLEVEPRITDLADYLGCQIDSYTSDILYKFLCMFGGVIEEDTNFIEFMAAKYEHQARKECEEEYGIH